MMSVNNHVEQYDYVYLSSFLNPEITFVGVIAFTRNMPQKLYFKTTNPGLF